MRIVFRPTNISYYVLHITYLFCVMWSVEKTSGVVAGRFFMYFFTKSFQYPPYD